jgi:biopolymer transport protein ExbB
MLWEPRVWLHALDAFVHSGGWVLLFLAWTGLVMWALLLERCWFRLVRFPGLKQTCLELKDQEIGNSHLIRKVSELQLDVQASMGMIKTLVSLCPLIGLLGTVTGMIQVFDVLAFHGTGNTRLMSAGVAKATIPTMAGMVLAVSGLLMYSWLHRWSQLQLTLLTRINH